MVDLAPRISADPAVCHGKPVIKGTRVLVSVLVGQVGAGISVDEIAREYGVQRDDVLAAVAYAAHLLDGETVRAF